MRYRKKPVVIEAAQFTGDNEAQVQAFTGSDKFRVVNPAGRYADGEVVAEVFDVLHSSWVGVKRGQWVIRGVEGEFYPCDAGVFAATYDAVEADDEVTRIQGAVDQATAEPNTTVYVEGQA